ncbi:putative uncharacterized protein [Waddlia chondrophila 2032/99]|uniref:Secreted protein n=2 Tax=Waddlia chondrophila TaxID=71667 RepID=D6YVH6_WADCW|nr:hypothetical protein [Waddlia chondrophila]ADI38137.1 hypothetical protein wcw_0770 [Waddlia chondrophila WSU 86-1044]CCB91172.1 putative uncharacterized protein [Waddlia chondrophila 2032/99]
MKTKQFLNVFLGLALFSMPLSADEVETEERIPVGDRAVVRAEQVKMYEDRLVQMEEADEEESQDEEANAKKIVKKDFLQATYVTTHEGAFHFPIAVSFLGDTVELEDGSIWKVCSNDAYKTLNWLTSDMIIIVPNDSIFSSHDYKLVNLNTGAKVKVNLYLGPIYNGAYTHWIVAIDYLFREIYLEDGSIWKMSSFDQSIVNTWLPNDTVIIGINDGFFSGTNPNILINVNMNNYSIGTCLY